MHYTLSQLQALPDDGLVSLCATGVMKWQLEDTGIPEYGHCAEHGITGESRTITVKRWWENYNPKKRTGTKVMGSYWTAFSGRGWNPLTNWNDTMKVIYCLKSRGEQVVLDFYNRADGDLCEIAKPSDRGSTGVSCDDMQRAIVIASILATQS